MEFLFLEDLPAKIKLLRVIDCCPKEEIGLTIFEIREMGITVSWDILENLVEQSFLIKIFVDDDVLYQINHPGAQFLVYVARLEKVLLT